MTRYFLILAVALALVVGCKDTTNNNADTDSNETDLIVDDGNVGDDELDSQSEIDNIPDSDTVFIDDLVDGDVVDMDEADDLMDGADEGDEIDEYPDADCLEIACYDFTVKVSGAVVNEKGVPIPGIAVALYDDGVISSPQFMSNEEGAWIIEYTYGECGGTDEGVVDAKVIATDIDGSMNGIYIETVIDFSPWNIKNREWVPPCINSDVYLEELGIQVVMQSEQPDDDALLTDAN